MIPCSECSYYRLTTKWMHAPFKLGGASPRGTDCFGVSLRIAQEGGLISESQFKAIHSVTVLRVLRKDGLQALMSFLREVSGGRVIETTDPRALKCGDWVIKIVGRNFDVECALRIGLGFITAAPRMGVTMIPRFNFDFIVSWGGFAPDVNLCHSGTLCHSLCG